MLNSWLTAASLTFYRGILGLSVEKRSSFSVKYKFGIERCTHSRPEKKLTASFWSALAVVWELTLVVDFVRLRSNVGVNIHAMKCMYSYNSMWIFVHLYVCERTTLPSLCIVTKFDLHIIASGQHHGRIKNFPDSCNMTTIYDISSSCGFPPRSLFVHLGPEPWQAGLLVGNCKSIDPQRTNIKMAAADLKHEPRTRLFSAILKALPYKFHFVYDINSWGDSPSKILRKPTAL